MPPPRAAPAGTLRLGAHERQSLAMPPGRRSCQTPDPAARSASWLAALLARSSLASPADRT
eukprot:6915001-Prymnesium_polylepis.1